MPRYAKGPGIEISVSSCWAVEEPRKGGGALGGCFGEVWRTVTSPWYLH